MKRSEYVKVSDIKFYSRYKIEETLYRLKKVHKFDLIIRDSSTSEIGYTLNSVGYDLLAPRDPGTGDQLYQEAGGGYLRPADQSAGYRRTGPGYR